MIWTRAAEWAVLLVNLVLLIPFAYLGIATLAAACYRRRPLRPGDRPSARFLIVIPAHNEEQGVGLTVANCLALDYPRELFDVQVIADNCDDATARVARDAGALVFERFDATRKAKGFALETLFAHLAETGEDDRYDAAVVIDADTVADPDMLRYFAREIADGRDWMQCYYTVRNADQSWRTRLMTYAYSLINGVMSLGQHQLNLGTGLRGNGMAFTFKGLKRFPWCSYGLAEDMEFCWQLRVAGERVSFIPETRVYAEMVSRGGAGAAAQRRRWEVGRASLKGMFAGPLLRSPKVGLAAKLLYLLDLCLPPLSRLGLALLVATALTLAASLWPSTAGSAMPAALAANGLLWACLLAYLTSPFVLMRLPLRYGLSLAYAPAYAAWKLTLLLKPRPQAWVRTQREQAAQ